jgi:hypothetical protein
VPQENNKRKKFNLSRHSRGELLMRCGGPLSAIADAISHLLFNTARSANTSGKVRLFFIAMCQEKILGGKNFD